VKETQGQGQGGSIRKQVSDVAEEEKDGDDGNSNDNDSSSDKSDDVNDSGGDGKDQVVSPPTTPTSDAGDGSAAPPLPPLRGTARSGGRPQRRPGGYKPKNGGDKKKKKKADKPETTKPGRFWGDPRDKPLTEEEQAALDRSKKGEDGSSSPTSKPRHVSNPHLPASGEVAELVADDAETASSSWGGIASSSIGSFFKGLTGNKVLTAADLEKPLQQMRDSLVSKNVATEVANSLCESVSQSIQGQTLGSFTRVGSVVQEAFEAALLRILTPKKSTDVLREALAAKEQGRVYSVVFIGVNGVGKSTSLAKVCYYMKAQGLKVMLVACDTFRSGAVEQLKVHADAMDVPLFERGYVKDPASVAIDGVKAAQQGGYDVVLIDTAGRMQNNEPLMRALAKLVDKNAPDLVLFVGEALVGNDGIDQLMLFNRALKDFSLARVPRLIDGIVLTKFDTIDDKVGAAVSMVHKTGQPIMFVGTGQKYTNLNRLNVKKVLAALMS
jgi:signal recognition particle receptor subunit alpha